MGQSNSRDAYLYGTISVLVISLLSLGGAVTLPMLRRGSHSRWLHLFIALAIATLCSDAILHMMPDILGLHDHEEHEGEEHELHSEEEEEEGHGNEEQEFQGHLIKLSLVMLAIYVFYLFEVITGRISKERRTKSEKKEPKSFRANGEVELYRLTPTTGPAIPIAWTPIYPSEYMPSRDGLPLYARASVSNGTPPKMEELQEKEKSSWDHQKPLFWGIKPMALLILVGDAIHNFADGLAIGASFSRSNSSGLSTSLAVACHELPHELGDFAILISTGLSIWKSLLFNFLSALTAFVGLYIGISLGQDAGSRPWLFALAAGMFLYVALVDMMNHLKESTTDDSWLVQMLLQNLGFLFGWAIIFVIGWFEHEIKI